MTRHTLTLADVKSSIDSASALIFDNDGTLVHSMPAHYRAWNSALATLGLVFPEPQFYALAGLPAADILKILSQQQGVVGVTVDQLQQARAHYLKALLPTIKPVQVVLQLLQYALHKNIPVAIASGGERHHVIDSLKIAHIDINCFQAIVTAEDVVNGKPHPETFLTAAARLAVDPASCLGFEDGDKGIEALNAAAIPAVDVRLIQGYPLPPSFL